MTKKVQSIALVVFVLCVILSSCFGRSNVSYETDFYEKYYIDDPNLFWTAAGTWEKVTYKTPADSPIEWDELRYATIPDTDPEFFLVTRRAKYTIFGLSDDFALYQSHEAPIPTQDWSIADMQIFIDELSSAPDDVNTYEQFYQTMIDNGTQVFTWSEQDCPPNLAEEMQTSWNSQLIDLKEKNAKK